MLPIAATIIRIERIFGTICNIGKKINVTKKNEYYIRHAIAMLVLVNVTLRSLDNEINVIFFLRNTRIRIFLVSRHLRKTYLTD